MSIASARRLSVLLTLLTTIPVLLSTTAFAQTGTGGLQGRVLDEQGAVLPGVPVVARAQESGLFRQAVSATDGSYRFLAMAPGVYVIEATLSGFAPYRRENVRLEIGQTTTFDIQMTVRGQAEEVTVTAEAPIVDTTSSQVGGTLSNREMTELPSMNRNFTAYLALLPGTVPTYNLTSFGADSVQTGGQPAGNVNYNLDGGANNDSARGGGSGAQARMPIEAIQEFQFLTGQFDAEYGGTSGAIVNAVSKQGSNSWQGTGFLFLKDARMTARDYFVKKNSLEKPNTKEHQFGGTFGGPIVRNRAFFFGSFERIIQNLGVTIDIPARPELNFSDTFKTRLVNWFGRFDHQVNDNHTWGVRWLGELSPQRTRLTNTNVTRARATAAEDDFDSMVVGTLNSVFGQSLNTFRASFTFEDFTSGDVDILNDFTQLANLAPSLAFQGFGDGPPNLANGGKDQNVLVNDTFSFYRSGPFGGHSFKVGAEYSYYWNQFRQGGSLNGVFSFSSSVGPFNPADPRTYPDRLEIRVPTASNPLVKNHYFATFIQDKWTPTGRLTLSLGLRYELNRIPIVERDNPLFADPNKAPVDKNDFSPRLGFSWDPFGDRRSVIRGGYGMFYNHFRTGSADAYVTNGVFSDSFIVSFPESGQNDPGPSSGQFPTHPMLVNGPVVNRQLLDTLYPPGARQKNTGTVELDNPDRRTPYVHTTSIGFTRQLWGNSAINVDYVHQASRNLALTRDLNPGLRVSTGRNARVDRINPDFVGSVELFTNLGRSDYDGLEIQYEKRPSRGYSYRISYTLGKCTQLFSDQLLDDLQLEEAPCGTDRRHNLTISGGVDVPRVPGLRVSGVSRSFTGTPFTIQNDSQDANRNGILFEPLPAGTYRGNAADGLTFESKGGRNGAVGPGVFQFDMRISYNFPMRTGRTFNAYVEVLNVTDHVNFNPPAGNQRTLATFLNPTAIFGGIPPRTAQVGLRTSF